MMRCNGNCGDFLSTKPSNDKVGLPLVLVGRKGIYSIKKEKRIRKEEQGGITKKKGVVPTLGKETGWQEETPSWFKSSETEGGKFGKKRCKRNRGKIEALNKRRFLN